MNSKRRFSAKRRMAFVLALTLILGLFPATAYASDNDPEEVNPAEPSVTIEPDELELEIGQSYGLTATVTPDDSVGVTWTSHNEDIATVDADGVVTGLDEGEARIEAVSNDQSGASCEITVTVIDPEEDDDGEYDEDGEDDDDEYDEDDEDDEDDEEYWDIADAVITGVVDKVYTGKAITQKIVVKYDGEKLTEDEDYEVSYKNNTKVGTATMTVEGIGDYEGEQTIKFKILSKAQAKSIEHANVTGIADKVYTGKAITQNLTVKLAGITLKKNSHYSVTYKDNKNAGKATVIIAGKGNYKGTKKLTFNIQKAANPLKIKARKTARVKLSAVKKKAQTIKPGKLISFTKKGQGTIFYTKVTGSSCLSVKKNGQVTVKKGTKKGNYTLNMAVRAAGNRNYKEATRFVKVNVKVS